MVYLYILLVPFPGGSQRVARVTRAAVCVHQSTLLWALCEGLCVCGVFLKRGGVVCALTALLTRPTSPLRYFTHSCVFVCLSAVSSGLRCTCTHINHCSMGGVSMHHQAQETCVCGTLRCHSVRVCTACREARSTQAVALVLACVRLPACLPAGCVPHSVCVSGWLVAARPAPQMGFVRAQPWSSQWGSSVDHSQGLSQGRTCAGRVFLPGFSIIGVGSLGSWVLAGVCGFGHLLSRAGFLAAQHLLK